MNNFFAGKVILARKCQIFDPVVRLLSRLQLFSRLQLSNEPIMQMWTSKLAMSEVTSYQYIGDTGNQSNPSQRKYFIRNSKLIYFLAIVCKTSTLGII